MVLGGVQRDERTDSDLVLAARGDDSDAFGQLFGRWFDRSWNVARNIIRQDDLAAEIAQDAMLSAWQRLDQLQDPDAFGGWLLRITRNRALNRLEHERRSRATGDEIVTGLQDRQNQSGQVNPAGAQTPLSVDALVEMQDRQELVWAAAAALGEREASLLDLHLRHGLSPAEIAQELGVEANTAHQQLFRLRNKLGDAIGSYLLWRNGRPLCRGLAAAVSGDVAFDNSVSRAVAKHQAACPECSERRERLVDPAKLFASVPLVAVPLQLKVGAASALQAAGVPIDPTSIAASAGPGAGGPGGGGSGPGSGGGPGTGGPGGTGGTGGTSGAGGGVGSSPSTGLGDLGLAGPGNGIPAVTEPATLTPQPAFEVAGAEAAGAEVAGAEAAGAEVAGAEAGGTEAPVIDPGQPTTILSQVEAPPAPKAPEAVPSAFEEWSRGVAWTFSRRAWGRSAAIVVGVVIALLGFVALSDSSSLADFLPFVSDDDDRAIASGAIAGPSATSEVSGSASAESTLAEDVLAVDPSTTADTTTSATDTTEASTTSGSSTTESSTTESSTTTESTTTSASTTETTASTSSSTTSESTTTETTSSSTTETSSSSSSSETTQPPPPPNIIRFTNRPVTNLECNNPDLRPYDAIWLTENADSVELTLPTGNVVQGPPTGTHRFCGASGQQLVLRALGPGGEDKASMTLR